MNIGNTLTMAKIVINFTAEVQTNTNSIPRFYIPYLVKFKLLLRYRDLVEKKGTRESILDSTRMQLYVFVVTGAVVLGIAGGVAVADSPGG